MASTLDRARQVVATLFSVAPETVTAESSPSSIDNWDSMGQLALVLELEQEFGVSIEPEQGEKMTSVAAIAEVLDGLRG